VITKNYKNKKANSFLIIQTSRIINSIKWKISKPELIIIQTNIMKIMQQGQQNKLCLG
jgi:hypothetical protein